MRPYGRSSPGRSRWERRVRRLPGECASQKHWRAAGETVLPLVTGGHATPPPRSCGWRRRFRHRPAPSTSAGMERQRRMMISGDARQAHVASSMSSTTSEQQPPQQPFPSRMRSLRAAMVLPPSCTRAPGWAGVSPHTQPRRTHSRQPAMKLTPGRHPFVSLPDRQRGIGTRPQVQGQQCRGEACGRLPMLRPNEVTRDPIVVWRMEEKGPPKRALWL